MDDPLDQFTEDHLNGGYQLPDISQIDCVPTTRAVGRLDDTPE